MEDRNDENLVASEKLIESFDIIFTKCDLEEFELLSKDDNVVRGKIRSSVSQRLYDHIYSDNFDEVIYALEKIKNKILSNSERVYSCKGIVLKILEICLQKYKIDLLQPIFEILFLIMGLTKSQKGYFKAVETALFARIIAYIWAQNPYFEHLRKLTDEKDAFISNDNKNLFMDELKKLDKRIIHQLFGKETQANVNNGASIINGFNDSGKNSLPLSGIHRKSDVNMYEKKDESHHLNLLVAEIVDNSEGTA